MLIEIREFTAADYDAVHVLWIAAPGLVLCIDARAARQVT